MTQSASFGQKLIAAAMAFIATVILAAAPASAAKGPYYEAKLSTPVEKSQTKIIRGVVWQCAGDTCRARKATSRPANVCSRLAQKMGAVATFSVRGEAFGTEDLSSCNAKA